VKATESGLLYELIVGIKHFTVQAQEFFVLSEANSNTLVVRLGFAFNLKPSEEPTREVM
jgi:hypothetical protein